MRHQSLMLASQRSRPSLDLRLVRALRTCAGCALQGGECAVPLHGSGHPPGDLQPYVHMPTPLNAN